MRVVVVGGGILGTMHALTAVERGDAVVHLERDLEPQGASVRNFGLVWVSGRAAGPELALALRARELWERIGATAPDVGFRPIGSLTLARTAAELAVLEEVAGRDDAGARDWCLLSATAVRRRHPEVQGAILGGLFCGRDAAVEPRLTLPALRRRLAAGERYRWLPGREAVAIRAQGVRDHGGQWHDGDRIVICPGATRTGLMADVLDAAPLQRVRIQMLETEPLAPPLSTCLADADTLRYYPAYTGPAHKRLPEQDPLAHQWRAQLLCVQRLDGCLTLGDTHQYQEPFAFDVDERPYRHCLGVTAALLGRPVPEPVRRWAGVYSQVTDERLYLRQALSPGVEVVTGPGGRGMTMAPAIAEETFA